MSFEVKYVEPGTKLWYVISQPNPYCSRYIGDIIVPVIAEEVELIYQHPKDTSLPACWRHKLIDGTDYVSVPLPEKDENGWNKWENKDPSWLGDAKPCNCFVWIDEPVGHAVQVGDHYDGIFETLQEAQRYAFPSRKKHLMRRLRAYRRRYHNFIARTWKEVGEAHPGFTKLPNKKIYVRKK
jgi:hypothetical protein